MKITVTGSLGNISKPLAQKLIAAGQQVTIVSSDKDKRKSIEALGAAAAIGSLFDTDFLTSAFAGADVVYTMVPPNFGAVDYREYVRGVARNYAEAIQKNGVSRVVNLSSIGAHLDGGTGQIAGNHDGEIVLNALGGVGITHLRPGFFYVNFFGNIPMIKNLGVLGTNYGPDTRLVMVHPADIATAAAEEILRPFAGTSVRYVSSDDRNAGEVAGILGKAIGKPDLKWVEFTDEQAFSGMQQAGFSEPIAKNFIEMNTAVGSGILWKDYDAKGTQATGKIKVEEFAKEFAERF